MARERAKYQAKYYEQNRALLSAQAKRRNTSDRVGSGHNDNGGRLERAAINDPDIADIMDCYRKSTD